MRRKSLFGSNESHGIFLVASEMHILGASKWLAVADNFGRNALTR